MAATAAKAVATASKASKPAARGGSKAAGATRASSSFDHAQELKAYREMLGLVSPNDVIVLLPK